MSQQLLIDLSTTASAGSLGQARRRQQVSITDEARKAQRNETRRKRARLLRESQGVATSNHNRLSTSMAGAKGSVRPNLTHFESHFQVEKSKSKTSANFEAPERADSTALTTADVEVGQPLCLPTEQLGILSPRDLVAPSSTLPTRAGDGPLSVLELACGETPYLCTLCPGKPPFGSMTALRSHYSDHRGKYHVALEAPCPICAEKFHDENAPSSLFHWNISSYCSLGTPEQHDVLLNMHRCLFSARPSMALTYDSGDAKPQMHSGPRINFTYGFSESPSLSRDTDHNFLTVDIMSKTPCQSDWCIKEYPYGPVVTAVRGKLAKMNFLLSLDQRSPIQIFLKRLCCEKLSLMTTERPCQIHITGVSTEFPKNLQFSICYNTTILESEYYSKERHVVFFERWDKAKLWRPGKQWLLGSS